MDTTVQEERIQAESGEDTYYDPRRMLRICTACQILSWFALALGVFCLIVWGWFMFSTLPSAHFPSLQAFMADAAPLVIILGMAVLLCLFFWVFLRAIAEALYILMDIQEGQNASRS